MTQDDGDPGTGSTTAQVKQQVGEKAQAAQERARGAAGQARSRLRDQADQRSTQAGERLSGAAGDVRSVAEELRRQGKDTPARLAEQLANQTDRAADYLKGASGERILRDVEDLARSNPWAVAAGGLALGFAASRFLQASSTQRYRATQAGYRTRDDRSYRMAGHGASPYAPATAEPVAPEDAPLLGRYEQAAPTATAQAPVDDDRGPTPEQRRPGPSEGTS
jgi:hypothetical protein